MIGNITATAMPERRRHNRRFSASRAFRNAQEVQWQGKTLIPINSERIGLNLSEISFADFG